MQYNQKLTLLNILENEEISISTLSKSIEVNRGYLSKLKNHNTQLSDANFNKVIEAYPEYKVKNKTLDKIIEVVEEKEKLNLISTPKGNSTAVDEFEKSKTEIKTTLLTPKGESRHRNLRCPVSNYHMKVIHAHLLIARPFCPISGKAMLLKEENVAYKKLSEKFQKLYLLKLEDKEHSKKSIQDCLGLNNSGSK